MDEETYNKNREKLHKHLTAKVKHSSSSSGATAATPTPAHLRHYAEENGKEEEDIHLAAVRAARKVPPPPAGHPQLPKAPVVSSSGKILSGGSSMSATVAQEDRSHTLTAYERKQIEGLGFESTSASSTSGVLRIDEKSAKPFEQCLIDTFKSVRDRTVASGGNVVSFTLIRANGDVTEIYDDLLLYPDLPNSLRSKEEREVLEQEEKDLLAASEMPEINETDDAVKSSSTTTNSTTSSGGSKSSSMAALKLARKLAHLDEVQYSHTKFVDFVTKMHLACVQLDAVAVKWDTINTVKSLHNNWMMPHMTMKKSQSLIVDGSVGQPQLSDRFPTSDHEAFSHSSVAPLSADAWSYVAGFLPMQDLLSLPLVSQFHFHHRETTVWATLYHKCFGAPNPEILNDQYRARYLEVFKSLGDTTTKEPPTADKYLEQFTLSSKGTLPLVYDPLLAGTDAGAEGSSQKKRDDKKESTASSASTTATLAAIDEKAAKHMNQLAQEQRAKDLASLTPKLLLTGTAPICAMQPTARGADFFKLETIEMKDPHSSPNNMLLVLLTLEKGGEASRRFARRIQWQEAWNVSKVAAATES